MKNERKSQLDVYIETESRNKLVIHNDHFPEIPCVNVGHELANEIQNITPGKRFAIRAQKKLDRLLIDAIFDHDDYGKVLSIKNLGILFEPELKINFNTLIEKYSRDVCLFIQWEGVIEKNKLFFLTKEKGIEINIKNLSHIII